MPVHLGQPRHQVEAVRLDDLDALGRLDVRRVVDRPDATLVDDDRPAGEDPLAVQRHDVDVDERQVALDHDGRRAAGAGRRHPGDEQHGGRGPHLRAPAASQAGHALTSGRGRALAYAGTWPRL